MSAKTFIDSLTRFWDWVDNRDIDKHVVSVVILLGTIKITEWAMMFAKECILAHVSGLEIAAVIGAVLGPYSLLQGVAVKFYFDSRQATAAA